MQKTITIKFGNCELECTGDYSPYRAGDRETPPEHQSFEVDKIIHKDTDVTDLVYELVKDPAIIEEKCLEKMD